MRCTVHTVWRIEPLVQRGAPINSPVGAVVGEGFEFDSWRRLDRASHRAASQVPKHSLRHGGVGEEPRFQDTPQALYAPGKFLENLFGQSPPITVLPFAVYM